jgi:eukaryotic-like serine/threonine-protein kinase
MTSIELTKELLNHFNINEYKQANSGGQKTVFIVTIGDKKYALKIINVADERFDREVKICKEFDKNKGIPIINRIEKFGKDTIILEEYIEGNDLSDLLNDYKGNENKIRKLLHITGSILTPVWNARYVHRDLKPQNIRVRKNGDPVVLDFGIARALDDETITASGGQPLSWLFASPEQYAGQKKLISYRTDFFCLGIIAFHLYTNTLPFGNSRSEIENSFKNNKLVVNTGNEFIDNFCNNVFKINPSERPRRIQSFIKLLEL